MKAGSDIGDRTEEIFYNSIKNRINIKKDGNVTLRFDALTDNKYDLYRIAVNKFYIYLTGTSDEIKEEFSPKEYKKLLVAEGVTPILLLPFGAAFPLIFSFDALFRLMGRSYKYLYNDKYNRIAGVIGFQRNLIKF